MSAGELVTAADLFSKLERGHGHRCMRGRAPEGYLEIWPDWLPVIFYISIQENAKFTGMLDGRDWPKAEEGEK
jgi:hypothetical protein